jgi:superfamily II DNA or RNA helicase
VVFAELIADGAREAVIEEMRRFPAEFLLFLPGDVELVLTGPDLDRRLRRRTDDDGSVIVEDLAAEGRPSQTWRVFHADVKVRDAAALQDATSVHARETVPLIWAAPVGAGREVAGRFYAFFPTTTETRTLGILNAPWKLNSDRTAVIPGAWNAALMEAAADLIASRLPELARSDDPGVVLDAFPRELQHLNEPAVPLVQALWARLTTARVLANCDADLMEAKDLRRAPHDSPELIRAWSRLASPEACSDHLHPSCTANVARIGRLRQLTERLGGLEDLSGPRLSQTPSSDWLTMAASEDPSDALEVLRLADAWAKIASGYAWDQIRDRVALILASDGTLLCAPDVTLSEVVDPPFKAVHPLLAADSEARRTLQSRFQISADEGSDWGRLLDARIAATEASGEWDEVWALLRRIPREELSETLQYRSIRVRALEGWSDPDACFRTGGLVQRTDLEGLEVHQVDLLKALLIDEVWHTRDSAALKALGVGDAPSWDWDWVFRVADVEGLAGKWLTRWEKRWTDKYWELLDRRPDRSLLGSGSFKMPSGWDLILALEGDALRRATAALLDALGEDPDAVRSVEFRHSTRSGAWAMASYPHPIWAVLLERGVLLAGEGEITFKSLLIRDVEERAALLPSMAERAGTLGLLQQAGGKLISARDKTIVWADWLALAAAERSDAQDLAPLYERAARDGCAPRSVCSCNGPIDLAHIMVAPSVRDATTARQAGVDAIALSQAAQALWLQHGARSMSVEAAVEWRSAREDAEAIALLDLEPALREVVREKRAGEAGVVFVEELTRRIGEQRTELDWAAHEGRLLVLEKAFLDLSWSARVRLLMEGADACGWLAPDSDYDALVTSGVDARRRTIAAEPDLPSRLVKAVGGIDVICGLFEAEIADELRADPLRAASVAITMLGPALLAEGQVREALEREGLRPPERWGGDAAAEFVAALGFPSEFAVSPARRREPELQVSGPMPLKPLHDYQMSVVDSVDELLAEPRKGRRRAVISLPTGAGKTRVAAQTAVTRILAPEESPNRLVVWIAQTDELCEQAVQCFRELWANLGKAGESLRIIRFWGGQSNPQPPERGEPTVVIASIQTLTSRVSSSPLEWVSRPGLVVIDECHHALTPSYTGILKWLGQEDEEPPVIGLSATPFRGRNDDQTEQLARRFDGRLLPRDQAGLFDDLQRQGVLATFGYTKLEMTRRFELTPEEERHVETFNRLPETALERLGRDAERNDRILTAIAEATERSALVFATSVAHARRLAARLNLLGVPSAVVSGETDRSSRRWFVQRFQSGDIRVLCNHSALTTGFDAPATDLIVIARPVFSPSLYMQMVGRGLRGPKNGGKPKCRILTVQDNLDRFSGELAHHYFEKYYL